VVSDINPVNGLAETEAQALGLLGPVRVLNAGVQQPQAIAHQLGGYHLIHMACHGAASRIDATESMMYLGGGKVLTVADILRAPLREKPLVFLAGCETAAPDPMLPDQTFGPPTAFLHAGASAVVAPIFTVQLSAARLLSAKFYDELTRAVTPDQALVAAQKWMATTATAEKVQYLRGLAERLGDADRPANALRRFARTLERLDPDTAAPSWWCPFQLNA
jgi:CHAT domain-containing protein